MCTGHHATAARVWHEAVPGVALARPRSTLNHRSSLSGQHLPRIVVSGLCSATVPLATLYPSPEVTRQLCLILRPAWQQSLAPPPSETAPGPGYNNTPRPSDSSPLFSLFTVLHTSQPTMLGLVPVYSALLAILANPATAVSHANPSLLTADALEGLQARPLHCCRELLGRRPPHP
jgi:hypothetical protein